MQVQIKAKTNNKYGEAVHLYQSTNYTIRAICQSLNLSYPAFCSYLFRVHRDLILERHHLSSHSNVKFRGKRGQSTASHQKYKEAIEACDSMEYIEYSVSQIARIFDLNATALSNQLRRHYPEIVPNREQQRQKLGISQNIHHGVRSWCKEEYSKAVEVLKTTDMTIKEAAEYCNVSFSGLREHLTYYHPEIVNNRRFQRQEAVGQKTRGMRNGIWTKHEPSQATIAKYQPAIEMYQNTSLDIETIVLNTNVSLAGFRFYLRNWYPELMVERRGYSQDTKLSETKRYKKSTADKYAKAIAKLQQTDLSTNAIAEEFGLSPNPFRVYVKEHYPELATAKGMIQTANGKKVSKRSSDKYAEAIQLYETTSESLKSIAQRLGLVYNSLNGFVRRNYPELLEKHKKKLD